MFQDEAGFGRINKPKFHDIISKGDYHIDLHCGDMTETLTPFCEFGTGYSAEVDRKSREIALYSGMPNLVESSFRTGSGDLPEGLGYMNSVRHGIPASIVEVGQMGRTDREYVEGHLFCIRNVLRRFGNLSGEAVPTADPAWFTTYDSVYAPAAGIFLRCVEAGEDIVCGQKIGVIEDYFGNPITEVTGHSAGRILYLTSSIAVQKDGFLLDITTALLTLVRSGDHILSDRTLYGETIDVISKVLGRLGVEVTYIDFSNLDEVRAGIRPNTKVMHTETESNPMMGIVDIPALSEIAHGHGIKLVVYNTFTTSYMIKPLEQGADVAVSSLTKFVNGHGDTLAGSITSTKEFIHEAYEVQQFTGSVADPFSCWTVLRSIRTLDLRMPRHMENATKLTLVLEQDPPRHQGDLSGAYQPPPARAG